MREMTINHVFSFFAVIEILTAIVIGLCILILNNMQNNFINVHLCKSLCIDTIVTMSLCMILFFLLAVMVMKTLKHVERKEDVKLHRFAMISACCVAVILLGPTTSWFGSVPFTNKDTSIIDSHCAASVVHDHIKLSVVYCTIVGVIVVSIIWSFVAFNFRIGVWIVFKAMNWKTTQQEKDTHENARLNANSNYNDTFANMEYLKSDILSDISPGRQGYNNEKTMIAVFIFIVINAFLWVFFIIAALQVLVAIHENFWDEFKDTDRNAVLFLYRIYVIISFTNLIVRICLYKCKNSEIIL